MMKEIGTRVLCLLLSCFIFFEQQSFAAVSSPSDSSLAQANQAAEILQIKPAVDRLLYLQHNNDNSSQTKEEITSLKALVLRKILLGFLDASRACNKTDIELAYTYGIIHREERKHANVNQLLNTLNFGQFSILYTLEPYMRISGKFMQSAIMTCTGAGFGTALPIIGIVYNKYSKAKDTAPPKGIGHMLDGGPVNLSNLPPTIERFFESQYLQGQGTRKDALHALWKKRYGVDANNEASLCSLIDGKSKSMGQLNTRLVLLWSLQSFIKDFDLELLCLLKMVQSDPLQNTLAGGNIRALGLKPGAIEAAHLLKIEPIVEELVLLKQEQAGSERRTELELVLLENVLLGMLEFRIATDKIDRELNYSYDVVLSSLLAKRGKWLQRTFEANFIQAGTFAAIAGLMFLQGKSKVGNEIFVIQGSVGTVLSSVSLWLMRGGSRKVDTPPNSLAQFLELNSDEAHRFAPLISDFLNAPSPKSTQGKSRREYILQQWKARKVATINFQNESNQKKLAAISDTQRDTIKIVQNRLDLMHSLKARLEEFDGELFELLEATEGVAPVCNESVASNPSLRLNPFANGMSNLLEIQNNVNCAVALSAANSAEKNNKEILDQKLYITRKILFSVLDERKAVSQLDMEIAVETTARDRLARMRDNIVNMTNNLNFFQINILGIIANGPLSLSKNSYQHLEANRLNIVSGLLSGGLTTATLVERSGGIRMVKAEPNTIGAAFGLDSPPNCKLSPKIYKFLHSDAYDQVNGKTRIESLVSYWKNAKILSTDVTKPSTLQKLSANGAAHHMWNERIKLISNRIRMLYDIRAVVTIMDLGMSEVVRAID